MSVQEALDRLRDIEGKLGEVSTILGSLREQEKLESKENDDPNDETQAPQKNPSGNKLVAKKATAKAKRGKGDQSGEDQTVADAGRTQGQADQMDKSAGDNKLAPTYEIHKVEDAVPFEVVAGDPPGHGTHGYVRAVKRKARKPKDDRMARKLMCKDLRTDEDETRFLEELKARSQCVGHRHVVGNVESYRYQNTYNIVMTPFAEKTLEDVIEDEDVGVGETVLEEAPGCLIKALQFIHDQKVCHNNLTLANILVYEKRFVIGGFGSVLNSEQGKTSHSFFASDLYQLGQIFLHIAIFIAGLPLSLTSSRTEEEYFESIGFAWAQRHMYGETDADSSFAGMLCELVFLLLESPSNKGKRITASQLVDIVASSEDRYESIRENGCKDCRVEWEKAKSDSVDTRSLFAAFGDLNKLPNKPLQKNAPGPEPDDERSHVRSLYRCKATGESWTEAKKLCLTSHVHEKSKGSKRGTKRKREIADGEKARLKEGAEQGTVTEEAQGT